MPTSYSFAIHNQGPSIHATHKPMNRDAHNATIWCITVKWSVVPSIVCVDSRVAATTTPNQITIVNWYHFYLLAINFRLCSPFTIMKINLNLNVFSFNGNLGINRTWLPHSASFLAAHIEVVQLAHWP